MKKLLIALLFASNVCSGQTVTTDTCALSNKILVWQFGDTVIKRSDGVKYLVYHKFVFLEDEKLKVIYYEIEGGNVGGIALLFSKILNEWIAVAPYNTKEYYPVLNN